jgi:hypothetical protein
MKIIISEFSPGDKVHFKNFPTSNQHINGIVKSIANIKYGIFVVYDCSNDWDNYENYTPILTHSDNLQLGWL